jgi:hypothetical protein
LKPSALHVAERMEEAGSGLSASMNAVEEALRKALQGGDRVRVSYYNLNYTKL